MTKDDMMNAFTSAGRMLSVVQEITDERIRQVAEEGFTDGHDNAHTHGELAEAAAAYISTRNWQKNWGDGKTVPPQWPPTWSPEWWKPEGYRTNLIKAAALLIAEIERLDRRAEKNDESTTQAPSIGGDSPGPHSRGPFFS